MNKKVRIVLYILLGVFLVGGILSGLMMLPPVQRYLGQSLTRNISESIPQDISIDSISIYPSGVVHLRGILLKDHHSDTLAYIPRADARAGIMSLIKGRIAASYVKFSSPFVRITRYEGEEKDNLSIFLSNFKKNPPRQKPLPHMDIDMAEITDASIHYSNLCSRDERYMYLSVQDLHLSVRNVSIREGKYGFDIDSLSARTSTGTDLENLSTRVSVTPYGVTARRLSFKTTRSHAEGDISVYLPPKSPVSRTEWIKDFSFDLNIDESLIDPADAAYFYPQAEDLPAVSLYTRASYGAGVVSLRKLKLRSENLFSVTGYGDVNIRRDSMRTGESKLILSQINIDAPRAVYYYGKSGMKGLSSANVKKLNALSHIRGNAVINTSPTHADASATLKTYKGNASIDISVKNPWDKHAAEYEGTLNIDNMDLGLLSGTSALGYISMYSHISGRGYSRYGSHADFKSHIPYMEINGYRYSNIHVGSILNGRELISSVSIDDPHMKANANDVFTRHTDGTFGNVLNMYIDRGHLSSLGIVRDSLVNLRASVESDMAGHDINDVTGHITLSEVSYNNGNKYYYLNRISISSVQEEDSVRVLSLVADDICEGHIRGRFLTSELPATFTNAMMSRFKSFTPRKVSEGQDYTFTLDVTAPNVKIINTPLMFDGTTHIDGRVSSSPQEAEINVLAQRINYQNILIDTLFMKMNTGSEKMLSFTAEKMINPLYSMQDFSLSATRVSDSIYVDADFKRWNSEEEVFFDLHSYVHEDSSGNVSFGLLPSEIHLSNSVWETGKRGSHTDRITWGTKTGSIKIDSLTLRSGASCILGEGIYNSAEDMNLNIHVENIDLTRSILVRKKYPLQGIVNGDFHLYRGTENSTIVPSIDLHIDSLGIDKTFIGDIDVAVKADLDAKYISTSASLERAGKKSLDLSGGIRIQDKTLVPEMYLSLDSLDVAPVHYLLPSVFNKSSGTLSAALSMVDGNMKVPNINGEITINDVALGIAFTNVEYAAKRGTVVPVRNSFFHFDNVSFTDTSHGTPASMNGEIRHDNFKTWYLDLHLDAEDTYVLNTSEKNNERFYGQVFASGTFDLSGPTHTLLYDIKGKAEKGTVFCIDVGNTTDFQLSEMIEFVPPRTTHIDSLLQNIKKQIVRQRVTSTNEMNIQVEADPNALLQMYLDKSVGHMLEGRGNGMLYMHLSPKGTFSMDGTFEVVSGNYNFVYENLFKRNFTLTPGGRLTFDKDPTNPMIDFSATYRNTTKPYAFLNSVSESTREEVLMTIYLTGYLNSPIYTFNIEMPKAPENVREELAYKLSDQEQLNQQFISLMVFNSFTNTGGENQNPNMVATGVTGLATGMLSNQFSNIVQKFVDGVDIDVNLNTSTDKISGTPTNTDFEVAISKKLFNDKVTVNGVVGVPTGSSQSNLVGDVEIEYNISADGRFRGIFVNRRQEDYLNNQQGYIQSIGVSYRQEFDTFRELGRLIKESFRSRKRKPAADSVSVSGVDVVRDTTLTPSVSDTLKGLHSAIRTQSGAYISFE